MELLNPAVSEAFCTDLTWSIIFLFKVVWVGFLPLVTKRILTNVDSYFNWAYNLALGLSAVKAEKEPHCITELSFSDITHPKQPTPAKEREVSLFLMVFHTGGPEQHLPQLFQKWRRNIPCVAGCLLDWTSTKDSHRNQASVSAHGDLLGSHPERQTSQEARGPARIVPGPSLQSFPRNISPNCCPEVWLSSVISLVGRLVFPCRGPQSHITFKVK